MMHLRKRYLESISSLTLIAGLMCVGEAAYAQTAPETSPEIDEIVVKGIRQALSTALDEKRAKDNIVEIINAEDVGKLPDDNLAEVLENITGVQIERNGGVGSQVSIRGLDLNNVEINGRSTVPAGENRGGVSFEDLPAELISSVQVSKVPTADMIEGSVGGTINLRTYRGLKLMKPLRSVRATYEYAENSGEYNPSVSGTFGQKFSTSKGDIGVVVSGSYSDQLLREDSLRVSQAVRTNIDLDGDGNNDPYLTPGFGDQLFDFQNRENVSLTGSLEWAPTDNQKYFIDGTFTKFNFDKFGQSAFLGLPGARAERDHLDDAEFEFLDIESSDSLQQLTRGQIDGIQLRSNNQSLSRETDTFTGALGGEWYKGRLEISGELSASISNSSNPQLNVVTQFQREGVNPFSAGSRQRLNFLYDATGEVLEYGLAAVQEDIISALGDPSRYSVFVIRNANTDFENKQFAERLDFNLDAGEGFFDGLSFGVRLSQRDSERQRFSVASRPFPGITGDEISGLLTTSPSDFFDFNSGGNYLPSFVVADGRALRDREAALAQLNAAMNDPANAIDLNPDFVREQGYGLKENIYAAYVKADIDSSIGNWPLSGNVGFRVVRTEQEVSGVTVVNGAPQDDITVKQSYSHVLPSLNLNLAPSENLLLRLGVAKNIRRPNFGELTPTRNFPLNNGPVTGGNPNLVPEEVFSIDLSAEYYFGESSLLSVGYYYKDRKDIISAARIPNAVFNPFSTNPDGSSGGVVDLISTDNADSGSLNGWEFALQHSLSEHVEGWLGGFGVIANLTLQEGDRDFTFTLPANFNESRLATEFPLGIRGLSETAYNITGFYEYGGLNARLRYTYRDGYLRTESERSANSTPSWNAARGQLNGSVSYDVNDNIAVTLTGVNLTKERTEHLIAFGNGPVWKVDDSDRRITAGIHAKF